MSIGTDKFLGEGLEVLMAFTGRIIFTYRLTKTRGFLELGIEIDNRFEHLAGEVLPQLSQYLPPHLCTDVVQAGKDHDVDLLRTLLAKDVERVKLLAETVQREVTCLDGNKHIRSRPDSIESK